MTDKTIETSQDSVKIMEMHKADINAVLDILIENQLESWNYNDFATELMNTQSLMIVAKKTSSVVGFCVSRLIKYQISDSKNQLKKFYLNQSEEIDFNDNKGRSKSNSVFAHVETECEIYNIGVKKEFQNQLIGQQLLNYLIYLVRIENTKVIWLDVKITNKQAIQFYEKNGFVEAYQRKNFYSNPTENALVMKKNLNFQMAIE